MVDDEDRVKVRARVGCSGERVEEVEATMGPSS